MNLKYHKNFLKDIKKVQNKIILNKLEKIILEIKSIENLLLISNIKKLKGFSEFYRIRIWEYRLGFRFEEWEIILDRFLHRKDIYKKYP